MLLSLFLTAIALFVLSEEKETTEFSTSTLIAVMPDISEILFVIVLAQPPHFKF